MISVALAGEDGLDARAQLRQRMKAAEDGRPPRQRDVHGAGRRARRGERVALRVDRGFDLLLQFVREAPEGRPLVRRRVGHRLHQPADGAALAAEILVAECLEIRVSWRLMRAPRGTARGAC